MRFEHDGLSLSATDVANHLACRHLTYLDLQAALGRMKPPFFYQPELDVLEARGLAHERSYLDQLRARGVTVVDTTDGSEPADALTAMKQGVGAIAQATLAGSRWRGRADVLVRVDAPSLLGGWSYEVVDTKLARETRGGTILQLCVYSELVADLQGARPEYMHVVTPGDPFVHERYRLADFDAYYRLVKSRLEEAVDGEADGYYPEPTAQCDICRWWPVCDARRRADDHLSLVAGISKLHIRELQARRIVTLAALAEEPLPLAWKPARGSSESYERVRKQARVQLAGRASGAPVYELLPVQERRGVARLPEPSPGDVFLDLEGDPFVAQHGLEYLFGHVIVDETGVPRYQAAWALDAANEQRAFERFIDMVQARLERFPDLHIYHFAAYEPSALKRLMGRFASREDELDALLREERFVDLHAVLRQGVRASVERYSLKDVEAFHGFTRQVALREASLARRAVEQAIELGRLDALTDQQRDLVERYNQDDCLSALRLRAWLERLRQELIDAGVAMARPVPKADEASAELTEWQARVHALQARLTDGLPESPEECQPTEIARWLLAQLLEWHRREDKAAWWDYFRLCGLSDEDLLDERCAISMLTYEARVGQIKRSVVDRYLFPLQETQIRRGAKLKTSDGQEFGEVQDIDPVHKWIDVKKGPSRASLHPSAAFEHDYVSKRVIEDALLRIGEAVAEGGIDGVGPYAAARRLLLRRAPIARSGGEHKPLQAAGEDPVAAACRLAVALDGDVLAVQGPPGSGKTYTGGELIVALIAAGKRVGVTALSHKVIRHQLEAAVAAGVRRGVPVKCLEKVSQRAGDGSIRETTDNSEVCAALASRDVDLVGGTAWLWTREDMAEAVDVLVVDEAAQMSLADVVAVSQGARSLVLLGDPRQLDQPIQGCHPEGTAVSALEHLLAGSHTMPADHGLFLAETWRLAPRICHFTSEVFYEGRLRPRPGLERQVLRDAAPFDGAGLWFVPVDHVGNQNGSPEEIAVVRDLLERLTRGRAEWVDAKGTGRKLTIDDVLVVAPYNAHVFALVEGLPASARVGTVDRFQGQEAAVVIYSMATSSPDDAPRGMAFLYSLNRLNVATSRARCACILVANPTLFEADCRTPAHMRLANAMCRYREMSTAHHVLADPRGPDRSDAGRRIAPKSEER